jgi:hypothetical protein
MLVSPYRACAREGLGEGAVADEVRGACQRWVAAGVWMPPCGAVNR